MSTIKTNQVLNLDGDRIGSVVVDSIANLKNLNTEIEANATVELLGYYSKGDGGGGTFYWDSTSIEDDNGGTIIQATGVVTGRWIRNYSGAVNVKWFGAKGTGLVEDDDTVAIDAASLTKNVFIPIGRFIYNGSGFSGDVSFVGERMPTIKSNYRGLENGSIIEGTIIFSGENVSLVNIGVDLGLDTAASVGDGIKCTTSLNSGGHLHVENIIAFLKTKDDAKHALLFESYTKVTGGNITGVHGFFGCVIKCQNVMLDSVNTQRNSSDGLYLKSDDNFGKCKNVIIDSVSVDGNTQQTFGVRLQSAGDEIKNVQIEKIYIDGCARAYKADINGTNGTGITDVTIGEIITRRATTRDIDIASDRAGFPLYNHLVKSFKSIDTTLEPIKIGGLGNLNHINFNDVFISYIAGSSQVQMDSAVQIGSTVLNTNIDNIAICLSYSTATLGGIRYDNPSSNNRIGSYQCRLLGVGIPTEGDSAQAISGTTATITVPDNYKEKLSIVRAVPSAGTIVTSFSITMNGGALFRSGHKLVILNNSGNSLTVNHNYGGKILNRGSLNVTIGANGTASWVFGGAVWHQL
jgi:hypothetical protein